MAVLLLIATLLIFCCFNMVASYELTIRRTGTSVGILVHHSGSCWHESQNSISLLRWLLDLVVYFLNTIMQNIHTWHITCRVENNVGPSFSSIHGTSQTNPFRAYIFRFQFYFTPVHIIDYT